MRTATTKTGAAIALLVLGISSGSVASAQASDPAQQAETGRASSTSQGDSMAGMDHSQMDHSQMDQSRSDHSSSASAAQGGAPGGQRRTSQSSSADQAGPMQGMDHSQMNHANGGQMQAHESQAQQGEPSKGNDMAGMGKGMQMGPMQGGSPPPDARDPNAYAEGATFASLPGNEMNDDARFGRILLDNFEYAKGDGEHGQNLDGEAWYGDDYSKAWFKAEGERREGHLQTLRTEALWDRTFATFWSTQLGVRHDTGGGTSRNWLAFGVRGLAPYWFDTEATAYWTGGRIGARFKVRYELLFTQRLMLEPELEGNLYGGSDPARGLGSGLSDLGLSVRLRYEIRRQFAPYIGVSWAHNYGGTADYARARGERNKTTQIVAGVRIWY